MSDSKKTQKSLHVNDLHLQFDASLNTRLIYICCVSIGIAILAAIVAHLLILLIGFITNLVYYGRFSLSFASPAYNHLGIWAVAVPVAGGLIVGVMARYGSKAIRGHGIPEAMEQIIVNESRIAPIVTILKPLSAAISIGTGGPFGAEGPIIATGGALGSLIGQLLHTTASERKTLLAAGAAAGMTATFGSPVAATLLAVELLLFEFRPRSFIPVALSCSAAAAVRFEFSGSAPIFPMPGIAPIGGLTLFIYFLLGIVFGVISILVTRAVYAVEDGFEKLPVGWMWRPAIGGIFVGLIGLISPHTLGVGYDNIDNFVGGTVFGRAALFLAVMKLVSWALSLGSGTSGGTLAPLFTIGGGMGSAAGAAIIAIFPHIGVDVRVAALVGMASLFAGASRALLTSIVFAFETTRQPMGLLPLLTGCTGAYLVSYMFMKQTIMTEKISRRGVRVPSEYTADFLDQILVKESMSANPVTLSSADVLEKVRFWFSEGGGDTEHQGYPVVNECGRILGVLTRRDIYNPNLLSTDTVESILKRNPVCIYEDSTLRQAADTIVQMDVGRLPVVSRANPDQLIGIITRQDILASHIRRLNELHKLERHIDLYEVITGTQKGEINE